MHAKNLRVVPSSKRGNGTGWRDIVSDDGPYRGYYVGEALEDDATLFAAAPELLDAGQLLADLVELWMNGALKDIGITWIDAPPALKDMRAAIAKAKGGAQ